MKFAAITVLLLRAFAACAQAEPRTLGLYLQNANLDSPSDTMMRVELQRILEPAGIEVTWRDFATRRSGEEFNFVVVGSIEGSCSAQEAVPGLNNLQHTVVGLADTSVSAGETLPYFRIDCSRLVGILRSYTEMRMLGRALARVIAHELYHILARTTRHQQSGIAKAAFDVQDLVMRRLDFDSITIAQMRAPVLAVRGEFLFMSDWRAV